MNSKEAKEPNQKHIRIENCRTEFQEQQAKHEQLKKKEGKRRESS